MKEKERYILGEEFDGNRFNYYIKDTETNTLTYSSQMWLDLLNQQDKRIKKLEMEEKSNFDYRDRCQLEEYKLWADKEITKLNRRIEELEDKDWYEQCIKQLEEQNTRLVQENQQFKEKLNNFETCMKKYNVEDIELLDIMLFVLSGETKYQLKEIKDNYKKELEQSQKELTISELKKFKDFIDHNIEIENDVGALKLQEFYSNQIKKLKGD